MTGAQQKEPVKIGVLTDSWGPTPATVGLRDGLQTLSYYQGEQFHIGVRFHPRAPVRRGGPWAVAEGGAEPGRGLDVALASAWKQSLDLIGMEGRRR